MPTSCARRSTGSSAPDIRWTRAVPRQQAEWMASSRLPRATWLLIAGNAVSALGTGLVLPLTLIYLHQVRGIALPDVGFLLATSGAVGLGAQRRDRASRRARPRRFARTVVPRVPDDAGGDQSGPGRAAARLCHQLHRH